MASAPDVISEPARRSVLQVVIHSPRPVWILVIGVFLNRAGAYFATFLALFLKQFGFTATQIPAILLVVGLVTPLGSLLGGWASDRFSRKLSLVGTTLLAAVGLAIVGFAGSTAVALVGVAVAALFTQSYLPAASALLVDNAAEADRVPTFAFFRLMLNLGAAIGPALAIVIVSHGLHLLFLVSCGCSLVFSLVLLVGLPNSRKRDDGTADEPAADARRTSRRLPWHVFVFLLAALAIAMVYVQYSSSVSLSVAQSHNDSAYATLLILNAVLVIVAELPLSAWTRRLPWWLPVTMGAMLMAAGIAASGAFSQYGLILVGVLVWTLGEMLFSPVAASAVASLSPRDRIGQYQGYLTTVQALGFALGPAVGTYVFAVSPPVLWVGCLGVGVLACAGFGVTGRVAFRRPAPRPGETPLAAGEAT